MTPEVLAFPTDPDPCTAAGCAVQSEPVEVWPGPPVPAPLAEGSIRGPGMAGCATKTVAPCKTAMKGERGIR